MQKSLIAVALAGVFSLPTLVMAEEATAPASPWTVTTNIYGVSDYYFRGITQTWHKPAIQGGADVAHSSGFYAGVWGSNVSSNQYPGGSSLEFDYYGGYNGKISDDWGWTAGGHGYYYPGASFDKAAAGGPDEKFNSFEANLGLSYKFMSVKYSYFLTDWFGYNKNTGFDDDTKGTGYLEFNLAYEFMPTYTVNFHAAHTDVSAKTLSGLDPSYDDYLIGVTKTFTGGWVSSLAYVKSNYKDKDFYQPTFSFANSDTLNNPGSGRVILSVGRVF
ncbi:MAG: TorF family putative porin [Rugosibacter sp.]